MQWIDTTEGLSETAHALRQPFEVLREVPVQTTARVQKVQTGKGKDSKQHILQEKLLQAFPPSYSGETSQEQNLRQEAYATCWTALNQQLNDVLEQTNISTFQELLQFAVNAHQAPDSSQDVGQRHRIIPAALTFAGGVNSADHAQTFPALVNLLRQQGCHAAMLQPSHLAPGRGISDAVNSVLQQYSGLETDADDMLALLAWYEDTLEADSTDSKDSPNRPPATPFGRMQLTTPAKATRSSHAATAATAAAAHVCKTSLGSAVVSPLAKLGLNTPKAKGRTAPAAEGTAEQEQETQIVPAAQRPLVVVIEEAEAVDTLTLQDFILVLSEAHAELPITLILGMATSAGALQQMLPVAAASMLEPHHFQLMSSMERYETLVREVLLGTQCPGVFFGCSVMRFINHQFMTHDFTTAVLRKGLQVACLAHFRLTPFSHLAASISSQQDWWDALPAEQLIQMAKRLADYAPHQDKVDEGQAKVAVQAALCGTCRAWSLWAVMLHWVHFAAGVVDSGQPRTMFSMRVLCLEGSSCKYGASAEKKQMLDQLCSSISNLSVEQCLNILQALPHCASKVWEGTEAVQEAVSQTQSLIAELQAGSPQKENQPQQTQPTATAAPSTAAGSKPAGSRAAMAPTRRNAFHGSAANRAAAMKAEIEAEKAKAKQAKQARAEVSWHLRMATKSAQLFCSIADKGLSNPPAATAGAAVLCCDQTAAAELRCLTAAPRLAIHEALAAPHKYLSTQPEIGTSARMDDACIAYQLFLEYGESVDVADWFSGFCAIHEEAIGPEEQQPEPKPAVKRRGRPSKKVLQRDDPEPATASKGITKTAAQTAAPHSNPSQSHGAGQQAAPLATRQRRSRLAQVTSSSDAPPPLTTAQAAAGGKALQGKSSKKTAKAGQNSPAVGEEDVEPSPQNALCDGNNVSGEEGPEAGQGKTDRASRSIEELAVRFSQATKELQVLGLLRPARKRRGDFAQKLVFHSGHNDMEM